jgi:RsiW-degrading membrane proteinase PrsW (M82 family)
MAVHARARQDIQFLWPLLIEPLQNFWSIPVAARRTILFVALVGILPLAIVDLMGDNPAGEYWGVLLYSSALWALFFSSAYETKGVRPATAVGVYVTTAVVSMTLLLIVLGLGVEALRAPFIESPDLFIALPASVLFIGVLEEGTKALVLFGLWRWRKEVPALRVFIFYGLMSGLGFGIHEGYQYQVGTNVDALMQNGNIAQYYLLNVLRLTALPFLHAVWTAIAAYMIWFGVRFPQRRAGFFVLAIAVPAVLHGSYDALSGLPAIAVALFAVAILGIYIGAADRLDTELARRVGTEGEA